MAASITTSARLLAPLIAVFLLPFPQGLSAQAEAAGVSSFVPGAGAPEAAASPAAAASIGRASAARSSGFLAHQLSYPRVRGAWIRTGERVGALLEARDVENLGEVFFRVFKREKELEVWAREPGARAFTRITTYPVCAVSGRLGPKRQEGDLQVPEGFYRIDLFNPRSRFHLSMRVSYPNPVDRIRGHRRSLGGDIFVHGGCATIGCVPVTDELIEEVYVLAARARDAGQRTIPIHIFPTRLDDAGMEWLAEHYGTAYVDYPFWENLAEGYRAFEESGVVPRIGYDGARYTFRLPRAPSPVVSISR